jgi:hypothetical protein
VSSFARNLPGRTQQAEGAEAGGERAAPPGGQAPGARGTIPLGWLAAHLASLAVGGLVLVKLNHRVWFWLDDWDFVQDRGLVHSRLGLWAPHNDHWTTLPILAYRALLTAFGMRSYVPFLLLLVIMHLAIAHVLWRMSLRAGASPPVATALAGVFAVLGAGVQDLVWGFQIAFVGSVLFGWLWLWAADHDGGFGRRDAVGWALGLASLMCSGIGVPMLAVTALAAAMRRGIATAAGVVSVPAAAFAVWYALYGRLAMLRRPINTGTLLAVGQYAVTGIDKAFSSSVGFAGAGAVLAAGLLFGLLRRPAAAREAAARAGAVGVVLTYAFIGIGRSGFGAAEAGSSRYVYIAIALVLPAAAMLLTPLFRPSPGRLLTFGMLIAVVLAVNLNALAAGAHVYVSQTTTARQEILASYDLVNSGAFVFAGAFTTTQDLTSAAPTVAGLRQIRRSGWLGPPRYRVLPHFMLGARARLQVGVLPPGTAAPATVPAVVKKAAGLTLAPAGPGCAVAAPSGRAVLELAPSRTPLLLTMTRQAPGILSGVLEDAQSEFPAAITPVTLAGRTRLLMAAPGVQANLTLPAGPTRICGLAPGR